MRSIRVHTGPVRALAYSPDGRRLASGGDDCYGFLYTLPDGQRIANIGHGEPVRAAAFSPGGERVAFGSWDDNIKLHDVDGIDDREFDGLTGGVYCVAFAPDGWHVTAGCGNGVVHSWLLRKRPKR